MSSSTERVETGAVAGVVRLLCDARLATLAGAAVTAAVRGIGGSVVALIVLALPFSFVPLRSWDRRGSLFSRSRILLSCDVIMTLVVMGLLVAVVGIPEFAVVYAGASTALFGVVLGRRWALPVSVLLVAWDVLLLVVGGQSFGGRGVTTTAIGAIAILGLGWGGDRLGQLLRDQVKTSDELAGIRSLEAAAQERAHLAREMHDSLAKTVHGIGLLGSALAEQLRRDASPRERTARLIELACCDANRDTRSLIGGLRALTQGSLQDAVDASARRWERVTGVALSLEVVSDDDLAPAETVDAQVSWAVVRLLDEALDNIRQHARASTVRVALQMGERVRLTVADDGRGFDLPADGLLNGADLQAAGHFGLVGMAERAASLGGRIQFASAPDVGTRVSISLPRNPERAEADEPQARERVDSVSA
jgi:signal transduction histidine kinase